MTIERARTMLEVAAEVGEATVQKFARRVLAELDDPGDGPLTPAERAKRYREESRRRHESRDDPSRNVTENGHGAVTKSDDSRDGRDGRDGRVTPLARDLKPDLSLSPLGSQDFVGDLQQEPQRGTVTETVTNGTNGVTHAVTHAVTHGALELVPSSPAKAKASRAPSSVDPQAPAFCRAHGIPEPTPGSDAAKFLDYWASRTKDPLKVDWAAAWRCRPEWTKEDERASGPRQRVAVAEVDPEERRRADRARNAEAERKVAAAFAAHPHPDHLVAKKAAIASHRPPSAPAPIAGAKPLRVELTPEERERRRLAQLEAAAAFEAETKKAEGT